MTEPRAPEPAGSRWERRAILANLVQFGRTLREAGIPVTTDQVGDFARALTWIDVGDRVQVFRVARATLVTRKPDLDLFGAVFDAFWSEREAPSPPPREMPAAPRHRTPSQFMIAAFLASRARPGLQEVDVADRSGAFSEEEVLKRKWFADMTPEELDAVRRLIRDLDWSASLRRTRRYVRDDRGPAIDLRRLLRRTGRLGALPARLPRRRRSEKQRPVILLADISGSMERYSRLVLQFFHAVLRSLGEVETFVFGTRLTRITPQMALRNLDQALLGASKGVADWAGGTRIGESLGTFNRTWSRRMLRRGAIVVIISDGCDRGDRDVLSREMRYLQHRCHRLIWLNPYLGHDAYQARAAGMAAALPFVDSFLPIHNVQALEEFSRVLARIPPSARRPARRVRSARRPAAEGREVAGRRNTPMGPPPNESD